MTLANIRTYVRYLTGTDTNSYTNGDIDFNTNRALHTFNSLILMAIDGWSESESTTLINLVKDQQSYAFSSNFIKIKRIEIDYDNNGTFVNINFFDLNETNAGTDSNQIANNFNQTNPFADISDKINLYPIPDLAVTNGLKVWFEPDPTELSADGDEAKIVEPFQPWLVFSTAKDYFIKTVQLERAEQMQTSMEKMLSSAKDFYGRRVDRDVIMKNSSSLDQYTNI